MVLVGDAAHAMTPDLGQGAGQALEDAVVLAAALAATSDRLAALAGYDAETAAPHPGGRSAVPPHRSPRSGQWAADQPAP